VNNERRLGRGLEALLGRAPETATPTRVEKPAQDFQAPQAPMAPAPGHQPAQSNRALIDQIDVNPFQPRKNFPQEELQALADSLSSHGLLQPIIVRKVDDRYQLVAGERRLRAAKLISWLDIPIKVIEANDRQMAELAIVENMQRRDLGPLEKAVSFQQYITRYGGTQEELAARLKLDRSTIANLIRLLELPDAVQDMLRKNKITQGHARALLPLGEEREQIEFCERIRREKLSVRMTETLVQEQIERSDADHLSIINRDGTTATPPKPRSEQVRSLEQEFRAVLGTKVALTHKRGGRGKLVIQFRNHEEFEQIRRIICGNTVASQENKAS